MTGSRTVPAETVLTTWLKTAFPKPDHRVVTETPANLGELVTSGVKVIQVHRFGGVEDDVPSFDNPALDFDCFADDRINARQLAYDVRDSLRRDLPGQIVAGAEASRVRTLAGPIYTDYGNQNVSRFTYSARVRIHTLPSTIPEET